MNVAAEKTTIALYKTTRNELARFGGKDSTFDEIVRKLLESTQRVQS